MTNCEICGEPLPESERMFKFHGYSGGCPKAPLSITKQEVVVKYAIKESRDGGFYIDVNVNGKPYHQEGPFDTLGECQRFYDELLNLQRQSGATDLSNKPQ